MKSPPGSRRAQFIQWLGSAECATGFPRVRIGFSRVWMHGRFQRTKDRGRFGYGCFGYGCFALTGQRCEVSGEGPKILGGDFGG